MKQNVFEPLANATSRPTQARSWQHVFWVRFRCVLTN